jgi:hypothetical protein
VCEGAGQQGSSNLDTGRSIVLLVGSR